MQTTNVSSFPGNFRSIFRNISALAWFFIAAVLAVVVTAAIAFLPRIIYRAAPENVPMPVSQSIEDKWGIRISMVAVTADGGMVDLRYIVLDPQKAAAVGTDPQDTPALVTDDKSVVASTAEMPHKDLVEQGVTYFLLYHNSAGAIKSQRYVTILMGDQVLENVPVR